MKSSSALRVVVIGTLFCCCGFALSQTQVFEKAVAQPLPVASPSTLAALPQVTFRNGRLTIVAENCKLRDVLIAASAKMGAGLELPGIDLGERVFTHIGPGSPQDVLAELLNGSRFNYVMLASPQDPGRLQRLVLIGRGMTSGDAVAASAQPSAAIEPSGPVLYGQGFSVDPNAIEPVATAGDSAVAGQPPQDWSEGKGKALGELQKQQIKQLLQEQEQQQAPAQPQ